MSWELATVLGLLIIAIIMFAMGRPRMDVVGILVITVLPLTGILTVDETLEGFADPNVILIAVLFVVGEGLSRTGITYQLGDWLSKKAGGSATRLIVMLMLSVAMLGAVMSSTGVVAVFIPVVLSIAKRTGMSARQLMMPLSFAGLMSGMLSLIATAPNLVINAELERAGLEGFGFFSITPYGLVILVVGTLYMIFSRRLLGSEKDAGGSPGRSTFESLTDHYQVEGRTHRYKVLRGSSLMGSKLDELDLETERLAGAHLIERGRLFGSAVHTSADDIVIERGDVIVADVQVSPERLSELGLKEIESEDSFFDTYSRLVGLAEVLIAPDSAAIGKSVRSLGFRSKHNLVVLGARQKGRAADAETFASLKLAAGDTILVSGAWEEIEKLGKRSRDYLMLDLPVESDESAPAANQAPFAILSVIVMIALMVTGIVPNVIAALIAALLMGIFGCINMRSAYRSIHWATILLIVGMMPFALALQRTGGVDLIVDGLLAVLGDASPRILLAGIFLLTALIGLFVSNTATAVLMAPIAIALATEVGLSPYPFAMIVALAASSAFMTPVSSPVNTLVVEPGRYKFIDFVKVGTPLALIVMIVSVLIVPILLPF